jgi:pimeloyl-ACP methyl ester carboxylesterase
MMIVSVAYPQENVLLGDNIVQGEAALLWLKNKASQELGITVKKVFLGGHSQGGYMVTRLNTMHQTNGVIANAPGPLNLVYRCQLEENGQVQSGAVCTQLKSVYGTTTSNPNAYFQRSLLNFTNGFKSDILFVQGLNDTPIQMYSWPTFKQDVLNCTNCMDRQFVEITGAGHGAIFESQTAKTEFNNFINNH